MGRRRSAWRSDGDPLVPRQGCKLLSRSVSDPGDLVLDSLQAVAATCFLVTLPIIAAWPRTLRIVSEQAPNKPVGAPHWWRHCDSLDSWVSGFLLRLRYRPDTGWFASRVRLSYVLVNNSERSCG